MSQCEANLIAFVLGAFIVWCWHRLKARRP